MRAEDFVAPNGRLWSDIRKKKPKKDLKAKAWSRIKRKPVAVKVMKDGREICNMKTEGGRVEYGRRGTDAYLRDQGKCILCGEFVSPDDLSTEHIETKGHGGAKHDDRTENLAPSHLRGNMRRGSMSLDAYLAKFSLAERQAICRGECPKRERA